MTLSWCLDGYLVPGSNCFWSLADPLHFQGIGLTTIHSLCVIQITQRFLSLATRTALAPRARWFQLSILSSPVDPPPTLPGPSFHGRNLYSARPPHLQHRTSVFDDLALPPACNRTQTFPESRVDYLLVSILSTMIRSCNVWKDRMAFLWFSHHPPRSSMVSTGPEHMQFPAYSYVNRWLWFV